MSVTPRVTSPSPATMRAASIAFLVVGMAGAVVAGLAGAEAPATGLIRTVLEIGDILVLAWFIVRMRPLAIGAWIVAAVALTVVVGIDVAGPAADVRAGSPFADVVHAVATAVIGVAYVIIAITLGLGRDRGIVIDGLLIAVAIGVAGWTIPLVLDAHFWPTSLADVLGAMAVPLVDVVAIAFVLILGMRHGRFEPAVVMLVAALVVYFVGDVLHSYGAAGITPAEIRIELFAWIASFALVGAAALHPTAAAFAGREPVEKSMSPRLRLGLLSASAVSASVLTIIGSAFGQDPAVDTLVDVLAAAIVILFAARAWMLMDELLRAQAELAAGTAFLEGLADAMPGAIFTGDLATRRVDFVSAGVRPLLGFDPAEVVGRSDWFAGQLDPDERAAYEAESRAARAAGDRTVSHESLMRTADGGYRTVAWTVRYVGAPGSAPDRFVGVALDVTEEAETARRLTERDSFIADIARASRAILFAGHGEFGANTAFDFVSPSVEWVLGYTPDEVVRDPGILSRGIHPDDDTFVDTASTALARGETAPEMVRRYRAKDGTYRSLLITSSVVPEPDGSMRFVASAIDITETLAAQAELAGARRLVDDIIATTPGMIVRGSFLTGTVDYVSPGIREILGYEPEEVVGVVGWMAAHRHPDDAPARDDAVRAAMSGSQSRFTLVDRLRTKSGEWRSLLEIVNLVDPDDPSLGYVATAIDITERVRMEEELRAARDAAQAADRSKSEFLSIVSHELRNPLNAILGHGELLDHADLSPDDRESLDFVLAGGRRLLGLINRMLDYARLETGRLHVASQPVILDDVVRSALDCVQGLADEQKVVVLRAPDSATGLAASADAPRLIQVVEDLVDNAVRHGGPDVHVTVRTHAGHDGRVAISVEDDGVGIPEEQLGRVFAPLERDSAGTGATLGLALARRLVEAMGGTISIASTVGVGTVATVEVPALGDTVEEDAAEGVGSGVR